MKRIQGEGWREYREKDGEDTGRRMEGELNISQISDFSFRQ